MAGAVPARPLTVPGLWPLGRLRGPPCGQARPGGSDFDLDRLVALCPPCHAQTDAPYARGRLVITTLDEGRFTCQVTYGADKWAIRASPTAVDRALRDLPAQSRLNEGPTRRAAASTRGGP